MLTQHIALVPETADAWHVNPRAATAELLRVSAALQRQVSHDLGPLWGVQATVNVFAALEEVPVGYWPIIVRSGDLGVDAGVYLDDNGQPYARIVQGPLWSLAASRACLEMLINPYGDRCASAPSPRSGGGAAEVLVEVCGACASPALAYPIDGVMVSDFSLPAFFTASARDARERLSFRHALRAPFEPVSGGHLAWFDPFSNLWWLRRQTDERYVDTNLGPIDRRLTSARTLVQQQLAGLDEALLPAHVAHDARSALERADGASRARAQRLRSLMSASSRPPAITEEGSLAHDQDESGAPISELGDDLVEDLSESTTGTITLEARDLAEEQTATFANTPTRNTREPLPAPRQPMDHPGSASELDEDDYYGDEIGPSEMSDSEVSEAVKSVAYDSATDVLSAPEAPSTTTDAEAPASAKPSTPPPLPPSGATTDTKPPVSPRPSVPVPPKPRAPAGQLSALAEQKESSPKVALGVALAVAAGVAAIWFANSSSKVTPESKPAAQAPAEPKAGAPLAQAPARPAQAQEEQAPQGQPVGQPSQAASPAPANPSLPDAPSAPQGTSAPSVTPAVASPTPATAKPPETKVAVPFTEESPEALAASERRRARRERQLAAQVEAPPVVTAVATSSPGQSAASAASPASTTPALPAKPEPPAARTTAAVATGDGLEDLIESRH